VTAATTSSRASLTGIGADSSGARAYDRELADAMAFPVGSPEYEAANLVITGRDPDHELTGDELVAAIREVEEILRQPGTWSKQARPDHCRARDARAPSLSGRDPMETRRRP
jgi:hypothetical protein